MTCFLYVLPLAYEDFLKVGISSDPLMRIRAFSRRYYESFDLARTLLVEFDSRREAQARETALHRLLRPLNAAQPITIPHCAAGGTEWCRGAYDALCREVERDRHAGHVVHTGIEWWRTRLEGERDVFYEWASELLCDGPAEPTTYDRLQRLADALDAWPSLGLCIEDALPPEFARWYRDHRAAWNVDLRRGSP